MDKEELRERTIENARELNRLHDLIHTSHKEYLGDVSNVEKQQRWQNACKGWHERYSSLCLPGGWDENFYDQLRAGDHDAIEKALCFLEVRPYFFRSGYHFKAILHKCKHAPMQGEQAERFAVLLAKYREWKQARDLKAARGALVRRDLSALLLRFHGLFPFKPVRLADGKFDGLVTVGDLYILLCNALDIHTSTRPKH
jgi:hypothetical protein